MARSLSFSVIGTWLAVGLAIAAASSSAVHATTLDPTLDVRVPSTDPDLFKAVELIQRGEFNAAEPLVRRSLERNPSSAPAHEVLGVILVQQDKLDAAISAFERAVSLNPRQATAYTKLGDIQSAMGQPEKAFEYYQDAVEADPTERLAHQRLGLIYDKRGEIQRAINHYELGLIGTPAGYLGTRVDLAFLYNRVGKFGKTARLLEPWAGSGVGTAASHRALANSYFGLGRHEEAIEQYRIAAEASPEDLLTFVGLGLALQATGRTDQAIDAFRSANAIDGKSPLALTYLADALAKKGEYETAIAHYEDAIANSDDPTPIEVALADARFAAGDSEAAIAALQKIVAGKAAPQRAYERLGAMLQGSGELDAAADVFERMTGAFPENARGYYFLGSLKGFRLDYAGAAESYGLGLSKHPDDPALLKGASLAALRLQRRSEALDYARRLHAVQPDNMDNTFFLASLYEEFGEFDAADSKYREILEAHPDFWPAMNNLAILAGRNDRLDDALSLARRAAELAPENADVADTLGQVHHMRGEFRAAATAFEHALSLRPKSPSLHYRLAMSYVELDESEQARDHLRSALDASGEFAQKSEAEVLLKSLSR